jgi:hypothetical protein
MNVVLPMVAMVFFCVLFVGTYAWMRRPEFGESTKSAVNADSIKALSSVKVDQCVREHSHDDAHVVLELTLDQIESLKRVRS